MTSKSFRRGGVGRDVASEGDSMVRCWPRQWGNLAIAVMLVAGASSCSTTDRAGDAEGAAERVAETVVDRGPVTVRVQVSPVPARLSDEPILTLTIEAERGIRIEKPPFGDGIGDFLIRDFQEPLPEVRDDREITRQVYTLEPTRTGSLVIDPIAITFYDERPQGEGKLHHVETELLEVVIESVVEADVVSLDKLEGMIDPLEMDTAGAGGFVGWAVAAVTLVVAVAGAVWFRRRRTRPEEEPSPYELAIQELDALAQQELDRSDVKLFYVRLTGIVRRYIERTTSVHAAEQTTEEFLREISTSDRFEREQRDRLRGFLESADLVKFAAHQPDEEDVEAALSRARDFVRPPAEEQLA